MTAIDIRGSVGPHELHARNYPQEISTLCTASRHGDANAYNAGCRCPEARADATRRRTRHHLRVAAGETPRVDVTGTRRRIRALIANGWPRETIAAELGISITALDTYSRRERVLATTAARVAVVYDRLADTAGPSDMARAQARARGWLPPLWWDDDTIDDPAVELVQGQLFADHRAVVDQVIVDRLVDGHPCKANKAERQAAVRVLHARRRSYREIAQLVRVTDRQIHRDLRELGLIGVSPYLPARDLSEVFSNIDGRDFEAAI